MKKQDININIRIEPINQFAVWVHYMDHPLYERVRFRRRLDQAGSFWHYVSGSQNPLLVSELQPERGYQYQMMAYCAFEYSNWTPIRTFTTPPAPPPLFECGAIDTTPPLVNTGVPLGRPLRPGDIVRLPQNSELVIRESTGTGPFRGYGTVFFNFFNTNLIMTFEDLQVDDKMQWITGDLISRQSRGGGFIIDLDRPQDQDQPPPTADDTTTIEIPIIIADNTEVIITDSDGNPITEDSQPPFTITITNPDGEDQQITVENLPAVITDGSGAEFVVNQDGTVERRQEDLLADTSPETLDDIREAIIEVLIARIKSKLNPSNFSGEKRKLVEGAIANTEYLRTHSRIATARPEGLHGATGWFLDGYMYAFYVENRENMKSTFFHEYLHRVNYRLRVFDYRYLNERRQYRRRHPCFLYRELTTEEFFAVFLIHNMQYITWPDYHELSKEQRQRMLSFKAQNTSLWQVECREGVYRPSNYYREEIAIEKIIRDSNGTLFLMSQDRTTRNQIIIGQYKQGLADAIDFENRYNLNEKGHER